MNQKNPLAMLNATASQVAASMETFRLAETPYFPSSVLKEATTRLHITVAMIDAMMMETVLMEETIVVRHDPILEKIATTPKASSTIVDIKATK